MRTLPVDQILCGDAFRLIREMPDNRVNLVLTSPPYFRQRTYLPRGEEIGELGREIGIEGYLDRLHEMFQECVRVVRSDGSVVVNLGDASRDGSLLGIPYRFAIAAMDESNIRLVNEITWVKKNVRPRGHRRRLTPSTESFFHFVKSDAYFYDLDAFLADEPGDARPKPRNAERKARQYLELIARATLSNAEKQHARSVLSKMVREAQEGAMMDFRMKLRGIHRPPKEGEGGQQAQWKRQGFAVWKMLGRPIRRDVVEAAVECVPGATHTAIFPVKIIVELLRLLTRPGDTVLDPFMGSGTTAIACKLTGRRFLGFELNPEYCREAMETLNFQTYDRAS